ncbi:MAG: hypothetical protein ACTSRK_00035 [Promethearchaeota archaeon]
MSDSHQSQQFPEDRYLSYPHTRLSKKKFLVFENDQIYHVELKSGQSLYTPIAYKSEIRKLEMHMQHMKHGPYLSIFLLPRTGKKKYYMVLPEHGPYKPSDWQQVVDFFLSMGFQPTPVPQRVMRLEECTNASQVGGPYRYFPVGDRVFESWQNSDFVREIESLYLNPLYVLFFVIGITVMFVTLLLGIFAYQYAKIGVWITGFLAVVFLGYGIPHVSRYNRDKKAFIQKYDMEFYFK